MKILSFDVGIVNLAYCIFDSDLLKIIKWEIISLENIKYNCKLHVNLITELDKRKQLTNHIDVVLIEKQPSFNPKMRIIAGCLQTYFYIRGVVDRTPSISSVEFFSPKNKLKCYSGPGLDISSKNGKIVKGKYAQTKKMGVAIAKVKLEEYSESEWLKVFENSKKKDDLSDCYLQALTYLSFKTAKPVNFKKQKGQREQKESLKEILKEFLDKSLKVCSVMEIMEHDFKTIHELVFPFEITNIEETLNKLNLKKYKSFKYN